MTISTLAFVVSLLAPGLQFLVSPDVVSLAVCSRSSRTPEGSAKARDPGRAITRRWNWVPFHVGPPSLHPWLRKGGGDRLGFQGVENPLHWDGSQRPEYSPPHPSAPSHMGGLLGP